MTFTKSDAFGCGWLRSLAGAAGLAFVLMVAGPAHAGAVNSESAVSGVYPPQPAFYKILRGDSTIYLFGSMHKVPPKTEWRTTLFDKAVRESDEFWLEVTEAESLNPLIQLRLLTTGVDPSKRLTQKLTPQEYDRVSAIADKYGVDVSELDGLKLWAVADVLSAAADGKDVSVSTDPSRLGKESDEGATAKKKKPIKTLPGPEELLEIEAVDRPVRSIENVSRHYKVFDMMTPEDEKLYLMQALDEIGQGEDREKLKQMAKIWSSGDLKSIHEEHVLKIKQNPGWYELFLADRNQEMAEAITRELNSPGTRLFLVGAAHLVGEDGVLALLEQEGIHPIRLYDTNPPYATGEIRKVVQDPGYAVQPGVPESVELSLVPAVDKGKPGVVSLRVLAPKEVYHGCSQVSPILYEQRRDDDAYDIRVGPYFLVKIPNIPDRDCGPASKLPYVDIPLDVADIRANGITQIRLWFDNAMVTYSLALENGTLSIAPKEEDQTFFKPSPTGALSISVPEVPAVGDGQGEKG